MVRAILSVMLGAGCLLLVLELGRRLGKSRDDSPGGHTVSAAIFGLMGLLVAFTFSGAATRFDQRRQLIVEETNNIGTAYLRVDVFPAAVQPMVRDDFRAYVDARLAVYQALAEGNNGLTEKNQATEEQARAVAALQRKLWNACVANLPASDPAAKSLLLSSLNAMFDIATTRTFALEVHPPGAIYLMLVVLVVAATLLAGLEMSGSRVHNWMHRVLYALILSMALYVIADLEYPRLGVIRVDKADHVLLDLRRSM